MRKMDRRVLTLLVAVISLLVLSSGVLGYQIGKGTWSGRNLPQRVEPIDAKLVVSSLQPEDGRFEHFDRLSISGTMYDSKGAPIETATISLVDEDGKALSPVFLQKASYAFSDVEQGHYTLTVNWLGGESVLNLHITKTQEQLEPTLTTLTDGGYTLTTYPSLRTLALNILLDKGSATLRLADSAPIGLAAYQMWDQDTPATIFTERLGNHGVRTIDGMNVVAPGSNGTFLFAVENPEEYPVEYIISLKHEDENSPSLPMRYRLINDAIPPDLAREEDFIQGKQWRTAEDTVLQSVWIAPDSARFYTLQWQWDPSDDTVDTAIGTQQGRPLYRLRIYVTQMIDLPEESLLGKQSP